MKAITKTAVHAGVCSLFLLALLAYFCAVNYIDLSVVKIIYLPMLAVAIVAIVFRQYAFGYIFTASAGLGLIAEYALHLAREYPSMAGAFLNTLIVVLGFIIGIVVQVVVARSRRTGRARG